MGEMDDVRYLPVYLVLDTSGSMAGDKIESVKEGLGYMISELKKDAQTLEIGRLSVITFADTANQILPLTWIGQVQPPDIKASGMTALGAGLKLLTNSIDQEVRKHTAEHKGDWKPLVFLMTDGQPTDQYEGAVSELKKRVSATIVACAVGGDADEDVLKKITENVVRLQDSPTALKAFIKLMTASIKTCSKSINQQGQADVMLPVDEEQGIVIVP